MVAKKDMTASELFIMYFNHAPGKEGATTLFISERLLDELERAGVVKDGDNYSGYVIKKRPDIEFGHDEWVAKLAELWTRQKEK